MSKKRIYTIPTKFVFEGEFYVKAENRAQAVEYVQKHCGLVIGGDIQTSLPEETVNWNFNVHPTKIVR